MRSRAFLHFVLDARGVLYRSREIGTCVLLQPLLKNENKPGVMKLRGGKASSLQYCVVCDHNCVPSSSQLRSMATLFRVLQGAKTQKRFLVPFFGLGRGCVACSKPPRLALLCRRPRGESNYQPLPLQPGTEGKMPRRGPVDASRTG